MLPPEMNWIERRAYYIGSAWKIQAEIADREVSPLIVRRIRTGYNRPMKPDRGCALIVVDVQNDFCPGGALPVPEGDRVVPILNQYIARFQSTGSPIFATRDWHPPDHISFKQRGGIWPPHCIQGTDGARFHPELRLPEKTQVISKGTHPTTEAYSGFQGTDFADRLRSSGVRRLFVGGLATDYCVKSTVLDGAREGFEVYFLEDASRGVEVNRGDTRRSIDEMKSAGARAIRLQEIEDL
jgi:nicotinamidase/pyrazinamidase